MSRQKSRILHFFWFPLSKLYKVSAKKVQKSYLTQHWRVMQNLNENWLAVSNMTWGSWWISPNHSKENSFWMDSFCPNYSKFELQNYSEAIFRATEQWCKIWISPYLVILKMAWGIEWTFIRAAKSLRNCTFMGSLCLNNIMF